MLTKAKRVRRNGHKNGNTHSPAVTRVNQRAFLKALSECGNKKEAAERIGIDPATPHVWAVRNEQFREKMGEATEQGERVLLAEIEQIIDGRVRAGAKDQQSAVLTMFRTKRLDPRYRDNVSVNVAAAGPVAIMIGVSTPLDVVGGVQEQKVIAGS